MSGPDRARPGAFGSLSIPAFRWMLAGNTTFFLAMAGQSMVRPYLAYQLSDRPLALGIVMISMAVPMLVLAPFGGALADRMERRRQVQIAQTGVVISELAVLVLLVLGRLEYWQLVLSTFALGCAFPLGMPARHSIVVSIVGKASLGSAVGLSMGIQNVTRVVGPALAGFLIPVIGVEGAYALDVGLFVVAVLTMFAVPRCEPSHEQRAASIRESLLGGVRYVREDRAVLVLLLYGLVPMFLATPFQSLMVVFTEDVWHSGASGLGIVNAAAGIGGVAGSVFVASRSPNAGRQRVMMVSALLLGGLLAAAAFSPSFSLAVGLVFAGFACSSAFGTLNNTAIQLLIPDSVRGRISSFLMMSFSLPMLGTLPVSFAAEEFGAPIAVGASSALAMIFAVVFYLLSRELRGLDARVARELRHGT